jgi:hypothetical protein
MPKKEADKKQKRRRSTLQVLEESKCSMSSRLLTDDTDFTSSSDLIEETSEEDLFA